MQAGRARHFVQAAERLCYLAKRHQKLVHFAFRKAGIEHIGGKLWVFGLHARGNVIIGNSALQDLSHIFLLWKSA